FISGMKDKLFPVSGVEKAFGVMHQVWDSQKKGSNLETYLIDQPHECNLANQKAALDFFNKYLK
ncbi:MAG: hypothetical protein II624_03580, partial [Prevotella sp.]|nr:hypothetical protein [Prevotella sp.]